MIDEKGLEPDVADAIGEYVKHHGGMEILEKMEADEKLGNNKRGKAGIADMKLLLRYCELFGILDKVSRQAFSLFLLPINAKCRHLRSNNWPDILSIELVF